MTDRVIRDGLVAVLISPGVGAGWSSWANTEYHDQMLFDPWIVDVLLSEYSRQEKTNRIRAHCLLKYPGQYLGGLDDLTVEWVAQGTEFKVSEYDGAEHIEFKDVNDWIVA